MEKEDYYMNIDLLGKIYIKNMIIFYDEPLVFSCVNTFGNYFIANAFDADEEKEEWIYLPISEARLIKGLKGNISAHDLFAYPEGGFLWRVIKYNGQDLAKAFQVKSESFSEEDLPDKRSFYNIIEEEYLPECKDDDKILEDAIKERRDILDLSLELNNGHNHELPSELVAKTLYNLQKLIFYIADKRKGDYSYVPKEILKNNELSFIGTKAASLRIRLKSKDIADISNWTPLQENLDIFTKLLECKNSKEDFERILNELTTKASLKYKDLLTLFAHNNIGVKVYSASPNRKYKKIHLTSDDIIQNLNNFDTAIEDKVEVIECYGDFIAYDYSNRTFSFLPSEEGAKKITGKISDIINKDKFIVPSKNIRVKIEAKIEYSLYTQKEEIKYTLMEFNEFSDIKI